MKIFDRVPAFPDKVNFVDKNNVVVGYDMEQNCCEHAGWYISASQQADTDDTGPVPDVDAYDFDPAYFEDVAADGDCQMVRFRLVNGDKQLWLHLFNVHNGYYSHGFTFTAGERTIESGSL